jgi:hypothetical protein
MLVGTAVTALACHSSTTTTVFDATTNAQWKGTEVTGATAYDVAYVTGWDSPSTPAPLTGNVTFSLNSGTCISESATLVGSADGGPFISSEATDTATATATFTSSTTAPLAAGSYFFEATYKSNDVYGNSTSECEPFSVLAAPSSTTTTVYDNGVAVTTGGALIVGTTVYDTATVTGDDAATPTETVAYSFFTNGACSGTGKGAGGGALVSGAVPKSNTEGPLGAGSYAFQATYSGDSNYAGSISGCEPFTVGRGTSTTATTVKDAATGLAWSGSEATGASAYDTATVTTSDTVTATGTVAYSFFTNGACSGTATGATDTVTLTAAGLVPNSKTEGPLAAGSYAFQAAYSGDSNYAGSTSACEPFSVPTGGVQGLTSTPTGAVLGITTPDTGGAGPSAGGWGWLSLALALLGGALLVGQWAIRPARIKIQDI